MKNLRISIKLYSFVAIILLYIAYLLYTGIQNSYEIGESHKNTAKYIVPALDLILQVDRDLQQALVSEPTILQLDKDHSLFQKFVLEHKANIEQASDRYAQYQKLVTNDNEKALSKKFPPLIDKWYQLSSGLVEHKINQGANDENLMMSINEGNKLFEEARSIIDQLTEIKEKELDVNNKLMEESNASSINEIKLLGSLLLILMLVLAFVIIRSIKKPVSKLMYAAGEIANGNLNVQIDINQGDEIGLLANSFKTMQNTLQNVNKEITQLIEYSMQGKLDKRADSTVFSGDYKVMTDGINRTLDNIINPLNLTTEYLNQIAHGELPEIIKGEYKGDFNEIKLGINSALNTLNSLLQDTHQLAEAAAKGNLSYRADENKHKGNFREIIKSVNLTLDKVIEPVNQTSKYLMRISNGDLPEKISYKYEGDFGEISHSLTTCIKAINQMYDDANILTIAAREGRLSTRANAQKHSGKFAEIISGVNQTLELAVSSLNLSSNVMISDLSGNITFINDATHTLLAKFESEIQKNYSHFSIDKLIGSNISEFHKNNARNQHILENLNGTHRATISLGNEKFHLAISPRADADGIKAGYLTEWTRVTEDENFKDALNTTIINLTNGELSYRINMEEHQGKFYDTCHAINKMLDSIINPLNISAEYINRIAKGDVPPTINAEYKGDFNHIKNNLNQLISNLNLLVSEIEIVKSNQDEGTYDFTLDESKFEGIYKIIASGLNDQIQSQIETVRDIIFCIGAYGQGDFEANVKKYIGKKNIINQYIDTVQTNLKNVDREVQILINSSTKGELNVRGDETLFEGGWKEIIGGFNRVLESVVNPISEASEVMLHLAGGDLTRNMEGNYKGEFASLKDHINDVIANLNSVLSEISSSVESTSATAYQMASTAETMAAAAQEQSAQADEVASAVEEMSHTITQNAQSASHTSELADENGRIATEGSKIVKSTITKMKDISNVVQRTANNIESLGRSSVQIGEIISVIDEIADQTNLLALNAAIEAARAGEQGRGFAVVADEVRKLAERTTEATKEIASMIKGIQEETKNAVVEMNRGTTEVQTGIDYADKAGSALEQVLGSTKIVQDMINQIAAASEEQSATSEEISKNVVSISQVINESASRIEDVAHSADNLSQLMTHIQSIVQKFTLQESRQYGLKASSKKYLN